LKLDRRSLSGSHIWDHVMSEIETACYIGEDRLAHASDRTFYLSEYPIEGLYVDPKTGLIREQWRPRRKR
jgi:hypothetical protein